MLRFILTSVVCVDFKDRFKHRFEQCKKVIQATNNRQASRDIVELFAYEPIYQHMISHKTEEFSKAVLPPLHIEGRAPQREDFNLERFRTELSAQRPVA